MAYTLSTLALLAATAYAKTDLTGCTTTDLSSPAGASQAWYVPGTGELCEMLDCGGGRAPPKQDVPGCAQYTGTQEYQPSFLAGYGGAAASQVPDEALATAPMTASSSAVAVEAGVIASSSVVEAIGVETATAAATVGVGSGSAAPSSPLATVVLSSASPADLADPVVSSTTSALATAVAGNGTAGSAAGTGSRGNATATASGSAVPSSFDSGASEIGRAWAGSAGVLVAVGAVVAVVAL